MNRYAFVSGEERKVADLVEDASSQLWAAPPSFSVRLSSSDTNCGSDAVAIKGSAVLGKLRAQEGSKECPFTLELRDEKGEVLVSNQRTLEVLKADWVKLSQTPAGHYFYDKGLNFQKLGAEFDPMTKNLGELCIDAANPVRFHSQGQANVGTFDQQVESHSPESDDFHTILNDFKIHGLLRKPEPASARYLAAITDGYSRFIVRGLKSYLELGVFQWDRSQPLKFHAQHCKKDIIDGMKPIRRVQIYLWTGLMNHEGQASDGLYLGSLGQDILAADVKEEKAAQIWAQYRGKVRIGLGVASKGFRSQKFEEAVAASQCALDKLKACREEFKRLQEILSEAPEPPADVQSPAAWVEQGYGFLPLSSQPSLYGIMP